jgi:hypothetical protein
VVFFFYFLYLVGVVSPPAGGMRDGLVDQHYFEAVDAQLR